MSGTGDLYDRDEPNLSELERELYDATEGDEPWSLLESVSGLRRITPSEDELASAEILEAWFDERGVPYERYDPELFLSVPHAAEVRVPSTGEAWRGSDDDFEEGQPSVKTLAFSEEGPVEGEAVYLDVSSPESDKGALEGTTLDTAEMDLEGKIVVTDTLTVSKRFFLDLEEAGAAALVAIHPFEDEPLNTTCSPIWGAIPYPEETHLLPEMVYATVARPVGDRLLGLLEEEETLELEVSADLTESWSTCPLVMAKVTGEADPGNDDFVLLHGHLDSWFYGVTDNATGVAGMAEIARNLHDHRDRLSRDLWVAFWPAHEGGRYGGSSWFVDEFADDLAERCVAHVNLDSPGVEGATEYVSRTKWMAAAHDVCAAAIDDVTGKETNRRRPARAGDYAFNNLGIPGMSIQSSIPKEVREERNYPPIGGSGGNAEAWHRTTDTIEKADPDVLQRDVRVVTVALTRLLADPTVPLDHRRTVERHRAIVSNYDDAAGDHFDLSPVLAELDALGSAVRSFYYDVDHGEIGANRADETIRRLSNRLVRLNFAEEGRFEQDPAYHRPPYPRLAQATDLPRVEGDEYRFLHKKLTRSRNHVVNELREARRELP